MDQHSGNNQNEFLWTLLANPANEAHLYAYNLQRLVNDFPQSGILHALLAHASDEKNLKRAAAYFNSRSLYKLINAPSALHTVTDEKIVKQTIIRTNGHSNGEHFQLAENLETQHDQNADTGGSQSYFSEFSEIETEPEKVVEEDGHNPAMEHEISTSFSHEEISDEEQSSPDEYTAFDEGHLEITDTEVHEALPLNAGSAQDDIVLVNEAVAENNLPAEIEDHDAGPNINNAIGDEHIYIEEDQDKQPDEPIENEILDETGPEHISIEPDAAQSVVTEDEETGEEDEKPYAIPPPAAETEHTDILPGLNDEEEKLIVENIAATDFFMFDRAFGEHAKTEGSESNLPDPASGTSNSFESQTTLSNDEEHQDVSKYHDEQMPYTFMWWLDKTRKEHAGIYQPYAKPDTRRSDKRKSNANDELQQQYYENIFHITSFDELDKIAPPRAVQTDTKHKEHVIIERFIQEEPQIKPQSSDKLDNENKAKKSSEDRDELVTETLADIYTEQMLYHKAIASYKKLMLKFPEKSRYFADKIEQLEKKTN